MTARIFKSISVLYFAVISDTLLVSSMKSIFQALVFAVAAAGCSLSTPGTKEQHVRQVEVAVAGSAAKS